MKYTTWVPPSQQPVQASQTSRCCIVGGGPAGVFLSLLLARQGIPVTLLEAHTDFERDFRGDTIHPSTLEILERIGLAERLHQLDHAKMGAMRLISSSGVYTMADFVRLRCRFPYILVMPQSRFLEFLTAEASLYPHFTLMMGANVRELIKEEGAVQGVRYRKGEQLGEVRAALVVGADGRFSLLRKLAGFEATRRSPAMDVLWFRLPRRPEDGHDEGAFYVGRGRLLVILSRHREWQIGYIFPKGGYHQLKAKGLQVMRDSIRTLVPWLADRVGLLADWGDFAFLPVESDCLT